MKLAIVHDYLNQRGGAERVVEVLHEMFPQAPIFTTIVDHSTLNPEMAKADIRSSWMQKLPGWKRHFKKYLPFYPQAIESFDLKDYDLILSSSSAFAKGALKRRGALHICYCYTPMRFVWDYENYMEQEKVPKIYRKILPYIIERLRRWDLETGCRPDHYVAISSEVKARIKSIYGREARIIFPPVETRKFQPSESSGDFYLVVSRLNAYKRIDLAIEAFNRFGAPLKIVGSGPYEGELKAMAGPNIEFLGRLSDRDVAKNYGLCKALIFPGREDFGLVPLEANASGKSVIAFKGGGALDTICEGMNGIFFTEPSVESLLEAIEKFEKNRFFLRPDKIREHALRFDKAIFKEEFRKLFHDLDIRQTIE